MIVEQSAQLVRHVLARGGPVRATGTVRHRGRTHAEVRDGTTSKLLAEGTVTALAQTIEAMLGQR